MGIRWSETVELVFEDCRIPAGNLLAGKEGDGFHVMMKTLDFSRAGVAAQALGIAAGAPRYATSYAKERITFGKPIIEHQGIGFKLADMAMRTEAGGSCSYKTCALLQEQPKDLSRLSPELIRMSSMSKCYCSDVAMWVATEAVQVLGGYGYIQEYPVERMMRMRRSPKSMREATKSSAWLSPKPFKPLAKVDFGELIHNHNSGADSIPMFLLGIPP